MTTTHDDKQNAVRRPLFTSMNRTIVSYIGDALDHSGKMALALCGPQSSGKSATGRELVYDILTNTPDISTELKEAIGHMLKSASTFQTKTPFRLSLLQGPANVVVKKYNVAEKEMVAISDVNTVAAARKAYDDHMAMYSTAVKSVVSNMISVEFVHPAIPYPVVILDQAGRQMPTEDLGVNVTDYEHQFEFAKSQRATPVIVSVATPDLMGNRYDEIRKNLNEPYVVVLTHADQVFQSPSLAVETVFYKFVHTVSRHNCIALVFACNVREKQDSVRKSIEGLMQRTGVAGVHNGMYVFTSVSELASHSFLLSLEAIDTNEAKRMVGSIDVFQKHLDKYHFMRASKITDGDAIRQCLRMRQSVFIDVQRYDMYTAATAQFEKAATDAVNEIGTMLNGNVSYDVHIPQKASQRNSLLSVHASTNDWTVEAMVEQYIRKVACILGRTIDEFQVKMISTARRELSAYFAELDRTSTESIVKRVINEHLTEERKDSNLERRRSFFLTNLMITAGVGLKLLTTTTTTPAVPSASNGTKQGPPVVVGPPTTHAAFVEDITRRINEHLNLFFYGPQLLAFVAMLTHDIYIRLFNAIEDAASAHPSGQTLEFSARLKQLVEEHPSDVRNTAVQMSSALSDYVARNGVTNDTASETGARRPKRKSMSDENDEPPRNDGVVRYTLSLVTGVFYGWGGN